MNIFSKEEIFKTGKMNKLFSMEDKLQDWLDANIYMKDFNIITHRAVNSSYLSKNRNVSTNTPFQLSPSQMFYKLWLLIIIDYRAIGLMK